ncbi:hypothetical protein DFH06DRAFT_1359430 [Mycena polygramma]|nr:hypothetical protein DFH06DRAFT_1359430 [Mycena polygramma]
MSLEVFQLGFSGLAWIEPKSWVNIAGALIRASGAMRLRPIYLVEQILVRILTPGSRRAVGWLQRICPQLHARVTALAYQPTNDRNHDLNPEPEDILKAHLKTLGVSEHHFNLKASGSCLNIRSQRYLTCISQSWIVYDVGGARSLRGTTKACSPRSPGSTRRRQILGDELDEVLGRGVWTCIAHEAVRFDVTSIDEVAMDLRGAGFAEIVLDGTEKLAGTALEERRGVHDGRARARGQGVCGAPQAAGVGAPRSPGKDRDGGAMEGSVGQVDGKRDP